MIYTGIGSRKTPDDILERMRAYGSAFAKLGFTLRSGAAEGADKAFETGCLSAGGKKEIFLPWQKFNDHISPFYKITPEALKLAERVYGQGWQYLSQGAKKLMARNCYQVLGVNLDTPSDFVVCWTPDGCVNKEQRTRRTGGTGQAIALADEYGIPVFNLQWEADEDRLADFLAEHTNGTRVESDVQIQTS